MPTAAPNQLPLQGLLVVDEGQGPASGLCTMVLADFGARVIKLETAPGDPFRREPAARLWLRGKRSLMLDPQLEPDCHRLSQLVARADVWVRGPVAPMGSMPDDELQALNPRLLLAWVSAFGRQGPYAGYAPHEALVAAKLGRMLQFRGLPARAGPAYAALQVATHAASQSLLAGVLAGLRAVERDGVGQLIETSLLRALLAYEMGPLLGVQLEAILRARGEPGLPPPPDPATAMPTLNYHPLRASDGRWLQMGNLLPHLFVNFVREVGLEREYEALGESGPTALWPEHKREAFRDLMLTRLQEKTLDEWQKIFVDDGGVASHPYQSTEQALADADLMANGHVLVQGEQLQIGLLANLTRTPGAPGASYPAPGEHNRELIAELDLDARNTASAPAQSRQVPADPRAAALPRSRGPRKPSLDGVLVVEAATIIAAPFAATMLADLGARVIKFEPPEGDPFRTMPPGLGAARVNMGKHCIGLDLKKPEARDIAQQWISRADIFIHNYRPGVPERLGLGYEQLSAINPKLVHISANGYGPNGPGALRPSTHPIPGAALGGVLHQMGGEPDRGPQSLAQLRETARRLMRANDVNPDPNTSLVIASAALLGLTAQRRFGIGQAIFVDMFGANAYANFDDALSYPGKPARRSPDRENFGLDPLWRLYACRQGWVMLAIADDREWQALRDRLQVIGITDLPAVLKSSHAQVCAAGHHAAEALAQLFSTADAALWEQQLASTGIGCVQADAGLPEQFLLNDPHARAEQLVLPARHPDWGAYLRHGAQVVMSETPGVYAGTSLHGQHTDQLLAELGISEARRRSLRAAGVVV